MASTRSKARFALAVIATGILANGCEGLPSASTAPGKADVLSAEPVSSSDVWAEQVVGQTGPNSVYAILVPNNWNGDVVLYAHGFRDVAEPVTLPTADGIEGLRDALGELGFAFAYSSFDQNGYALKNGMQRTHQLAGLFAARFDLRV